MKMWIKKAKLRELEYNTEQKRVMAYPRSGHNIFYSLGHKKVNPDNYQVTIEYENGLYGALDEDYLDLIAREYTQSDKKSELIELFRSMFNAVSVVAVADNGKPSDASIKHATENLQSYIDNTDFDVTNKFDFEEAMLIYFLAMFSEWYYVGKWNNKSVYQHRVKLLALKQVLITNMSPHEAAEFSKYNNVGEALKQYGISATRVSLENGHPKLKAYYKIDG